MDRAQDQLDETNVIAAAGRFFKRGFTGHGELGTYLQDRDAHSQFFPWLLWDEGQPKTRLGRQLSSSAGSHRQELIDCLIDTPPDVFQVRRSAGQVATLERVSDGRLMMLEDEVLQTVISPDELLVARVLDLGDCQLLDAVHACLPPSARRGMVRAARQAQRLGHEERLPLLMSAANRAMNRALSRQPRLTGPDGAAIMRATVVFSMTDRAAADRWLSSAESEGLVTKQARGRWQIASSGFGQMGATLRIRKDRLLASTCSLERADQLAARLSAEIPGLQRKVSLLRDLDGLLEDEQMSPHEVRRLAQDWLDEYLTGFEDTPQNSLGGITPRQAMATSRGRVQVRKILRSVQRFSDVAGARVPAPMDTIWTRLER
ncbi:MAG: hypothetical protein KC502_03480 [Myxococcales bacterium]|nr:hypothetical protein [Myxococcales bacterium]